MPPFGPIYCETPLAAFSFPAEPVNFFSNSIIVLFGIVALYLAHRQKASIDVWALALLLTATGVGSFLWHGFRTPLMLTLDVVPGLLFLLLFVYVWARRVWGVSGASGFLAAFFASTLVLSYLSQLLIPFRGPPLGVVITVVGAAAYLITMTKGKYGRAAYLGALSVTASLIAFSFRSIDLYTCGVIPFGTHFLWHCFLSLGAFLGCYLILTLDAKN